MLNIIMSADIEFQGGRSPELRGVRVPIPERPQLVGFGGKSNRRLLVVQDRLSRDEPSEMHVFDGNGEPLVHRYIGAQLRIGSDQRNDIRVPSVRSRDHAKLLEVHNGWSLDAGNTLQGTSMDEVQTFFVPGEFHAVPRDQWVFFPSENRGRLYDVNLSIRNTIGTFQEHRGDQRTLTIGGQQYDFGLFEPQFIGTSADSTIRFPREGEAEDDGVLIALPNGYLYYDRSTNGMGVRHIMTDRDPEDRPERQPPGRPVRRIRHERAGALGQRLRAKARLAADAAVLGGKRFLAEINTPVDPEKMAEVEAVFLETGSATAKAANHEVNDDRLVKGKNYVGLFDGVSEGERGADASQIGIEVAKEVFDLLGRKKNPSVEEIMEAMDEISRLASARIATVSGKPEYEGHEAMGSTMYLGYLTIVGGEKVWVDSWLGDGRGDIHADAETIEQLRNGRITMHMGDDVFTITDSPRENYLDDDHGIMSLSVDDIQLYLGKSVAEARKIMRRLDNIETQADIDELKKLGIEWSNKGPRNALVRWLGREYRRPSYTVTRLLPGVKVIAARTDGTVDNNSRRVRSEIVEGEGTLDEKAQKDVDAALNPVDTRRKIDDLTTVFVRVNE
jgi:serine/threonine protein phosphatase PrpC